MPYYHVYISEVDEVYELDLPREKLLRYIVEPYLKNEEFTCNGSRIDPSDIERIKISETKRPTKELIPEARPKYASILGLLGELSDGEIIMKEGKDVTRQFITHSPKITKQKPLKASPRPSKNIFIVHGRDYTPMKELKTMLYDFGLSPIVLHEEASGGLTLAEKLEKYSKDVGFAFVILTPEDVGGHRDEMRHKLGGDKPFLSRPVAVSGGNLVDKILDLFELRARQNVIFEMGYFWGLLERKRVCCLLKGNVEKPSDIEGIVYVSFRDSVYDAQVRIMKELKDAGYEIKF